MVEILRDQPTYVLITDGGGRGHVIAEQYLKSSHVDGVVLAPGRPGIEYLLKNQFGNKLIYASGVATSDWINIRRLAQEYRPALVDVCQDEAAAANIAGLARADGYQVIGADGFAAQIEASKGWFREMATTRWGMADTQPDYFVAHNLTEAINYIDSRPEVPLYIKGGGLAAGKDTRGTRSRAEALAAVYELQHQFNRPDGHLVIEEFMMNDDGSLGEEFSAYVLSDGTYFDPEVDGQVLYAQDYKMSDDDDKGLPTGSMGSTGPTNLIDADDDLFVRRRMFAPILNGLRDMGHPYVGYLYISGIKYTRNGMLQRKIVEVNARFGDPEAQALLPGVTNDYYEVMTAAADGTLGGSPLQHDGLIRLVATLAARGYPIETLQALVQGKAIYGIEDALQVAEFSIYGGGLGLRNGVPTIAGGRVLYGVGEGQTIVEARDIAYQGIRKIYGQDDSLRYRNDIGYRDIRRFQLAA